MKITRCVLAVLALSLGLGSAAITAPPAAANHDCFVKFYTNVDYGTGGGSDNYVTTYDCPSYGYAYDYNPIGWPQEGAVSSMKVSMPDGWCARPSDNNQWIFGPLYGPGDWDIASLVPYGWNDRITKLHIMTDPYCY